MRQVLVFHYQEPGGNYQRQDKDNACINPTLLMKGAVAFPVCFPGQFLMKILVKLVNKNRDILFFSNRFQAFHGVIEKFAVGQMQFHHPLFCFGQFAGEIIQQLLIGNGGMWMTA